MPVTTPVNRATPKPISAIRGSSDRSRLGGEYARSTSVAQTAICSPATPPAAASITDSTRSRRISRPRLAPIARRTAISFRRRSPRASRSPATFAEATSNTSPAAPASSATIGSVRRPAPASGCREPGEPGRRVPLKSSGYNGFELPHQPRHFGVRLVNRRVPGQPADDADPTAGPRQRRVAVARRDADTSPSGSRRRSAPDRRRCRGNAPARSRSR